MIVDWAWVRNYENIANDIARGPFHFIERKPTHFGYQWAVGQGTFVAALFCTSTDHLAVADLNLAIDLCEARYGRTEP